MPSSDLINEAERQMTICNACRYCEGYCAVFPAMESRRTFNAEDLIYMANLCFECRACYYACQYAPPHDFKINIPEVLSELRVETYRDFTWGSLLTRLFQGNRGAVSLTVGFFVALIFGSVLLVQGSDVLFKANTASGAFYDVIPYYAMVVPAMLLSIYGAGALLIGGMRFWRSTGARLGELFDGKSFAKATRDAFGLEYMKGGDAGGCFYPDWRTSSARRWSHHLVFYGFLFAFASTCVAALYHNFLNRESPYGYTSWPVVLGVIGGVMIALGVVGLLWLKSKADSAPAYERMLAIDHVFLVMLLLTSLTGLLLLVMRQSAIMGTLLSVHLGVVAALYLTIPYGKFAHVVYRYAALIRYQIERARHAAAHASA